MLDNVKVAAMLSAIHGDAILEALGVEKGWPSTNYVENDFNEPLQSHARAKRAKPILLCGGRTASHLAISKTLLPFSLARLRQHLGDPQIAKHSLETLLFQSRLSPLKSVHSLTMDRGEV
jgi:hypothetical protein